MSKKTNKTNKDIKLRYIQEFNSKINKEVLEDLINLNQNLIIDETWKTDPSKDPKDQGNEDKLVLTLDPDNRKETSYKLIKNLPKSRDYESEDETSETDISTGKYHREVYLLGFLRASSKDNKTFKIDKKSDQEKEISYRLQTTVENIADQADPFDIDKYDEDPDEYLEDSNKTLRIITSKKPSNHKIIGYLKINGDNLPQEVKDQLKTKEELNLDDEVTLINEFYIAVTVATWLPLILLLGIATCIILCLIMFLFPAPKAPTYEQGNINQNGQEWDGTTQQQGDSSQKSETEMIAIPGYYKVTLTSEVTGIRLLNPNNNVYLRYVITNKDTGEQLFDSDYIDLNSEVVWEAWDQLDAGTYTVTMNISSADPNTWEPCNGATQDTTLVIQK